MPQKDHVKN